MKDGAIVCNSGHFNVEIDIPALEEMAVSRRVMRDLVEEFTMPDGRRIILLGRRPFDQPGGRGRPSVISDGYELCNQALASEFLVQGGQRIIKTGP